MLRALMSVCEMYIIIIIIIIVVVVVVVDVVILIIIIIIIIKGKPIEVAESKAVLLLTSLTPYRWAKPSHVQDSVLQPQIVETKEMAESNPSPSAYKPNALPLGQSK